MNRNLHKIFAPFKTDGLAQGGGIVLTNHAKSSRRGNHDQGLRFAFCDRNVQSARERGEKSALGLVMTVRLFHGTACSTYGRMRLARTIGALITGARLTVLTHLFGVEIWISSIANILEDE